MSKSQKSTWRLIFEIPANNHHMMGFPMIGFVLDSPKMGAGDRITKALTILEKGVSKTYFIPREFKDQAEYILQKMIKNPDWVKKRHDFIYKAAMDWFRISKVFLKTNFKKLSNKNLVSLYKKFSKLNHDCHVGGLPTTYIVDAEFELFTNYLTEYLSDLIQKRNQALDPATVFSVLSTPEKEANIVKENKKSLKIALLISRFSKSRKLFKKAKTEDIKKNLDNIEPGVKRKILAHFKKWRWIPYNYEGPAWDIEYFLDVWRGLIRQNTNVNQELKKIEAERENIKKRKRELYKRLKPDKIHKFLLDTAAEIVYLKALRKDAHYFGCYALEGFWKEICRKFGLSLKQAYQLLPWEIPDAVLREKFDIDELNKRYEFSAFYAHKKGYKIYLAEETKQYLKTQKFEKVKIKKIKKLKGTCAQSGKARGIVKIIIVPADMKKMKKGNILVAQTTNPNVVPAMRKAAAIISDQGGITCHAAIVSRELKIPCVVGTKIGTKVLKDGDRVEVDAIKGTVKKL